MSSHQFADSVAQVRRSQELEGRRLSVSKQGSGKHPGSAGAKRPFIPKGHDAVLNRLQNSPDAQIELGLVSGDKITGKVVARDKFTITVKTTSLTTGVARELTIYKHAIEFFTKLGE